MLWQTCCQRILPACLLLTLWTAPSTGAAQVSSQPAAQISAEQQQNIQTMGYNAGFRDGTDDARSNRSFNFQDHPVWQNANLGYQSNSGIDESTWQYNFRAGYERGYSDAFYGRNPQAPAGQTGFPAPQSPSAAPSRSTPVPQVPSGGYPPATGQVTQIGELPAGTKIPLKLDNTLSTRSSKAGDNFTASVTQPITGPNQEVLIPSGSIAMGRVTQVEQPGAVGGQSRLQLQFERLRLPNGREVALAASLSGVEQGGGIGSVITGSPSTTPEGGVERSKTRSTVGTTVAGTAAGSILGAIIGGGKGAGIGAAIGAGLGVVLASRTGNIDLPAGTPITITLDRPVQLQ